PGVTDNPGTTVPRSIFIRNEDCSVRPLEVKNPDSSTSPRGLVNDASPPYEPSGLYTGKRFGGIVLITLKRGAVVFAYGVLFSSTDPPNPTIAVTASESEISTFV